MGQRSLLNAGSNPAGLNGYSPLELLKESSMATLQREASRMGGGMISDPNMQDRFSFSVLDRGYQPTEADMQMGGEQIMGMMPMAGIIGKLPKTGYKPYFKEIFSPEDIAVAEKTARASGAVGSKAILPRVLKGESVNGLKQIDINTNNSILNFGSGPKEAHTKILQNNGFKNVTSFDHNLNPEALDKTYDTVFASNVLNVQNSQEALNSTLNQLGSVLGEGGQIIVNLPSSPRKKVFEGMSRKEGNEFLEYELSKKFNVEKLNTNAKQDPVFSLTKKTETMSDYGGLLSRP